MNRAEHIITTLAEECGEVAKECCKALRFGLLDKLTRDPDGPRGTEGPTIAEKIQAEFIDMLAVYQMAVDDGLLPDLGLTRLPPDIVERMGAKALRVESYMRYARRVEALDAIPKLSALACFQGTQDLPFRLLIEGPQGFSHLSSAKTVDHLLDRFGKAARQQWPPTYTAENLPTDTFPAYLVHPDYHEDDPPLVTVFGNTLREDGHVQIQWQDGTTDWQTPDSLRPVFWSSLDHPDGQAARPRALPFPDGPAPQRDAMDAKEQAMASLGARIPIPPLPPDPSLLTLEEHLGRAVFPPELLNKTIVEAPAKFPEGSTTGQVGLKSTLWPIMTTVAGQSAAWHCFQEVCGPATLRLFGPNDKDLGQVKQFKEGAAWSTCDGKIGLAKNLIDGMKFVEHALANAQGGAVATPATLTVGVDGVQHGQMIPAMNQAADEAGITGDPIPTGPITQRKTDLPTHVNGLKCVWRKRLDGQNADVWDLLVLSTDGQEWTAQDPIMGRVTEVVIAEWWQAEAFGPDNFSAHFDTVALARAAVEEHLKTNPL